MSRSEDGLPDPFQSSLVVSEGEQHQQRQDEDIVKLQRVAERTVSGLTHLTFGRLPQGMLLEAHLDICMHSVISEVSSLRVLFHETKNSFSFLSLDFVITLGKDVHDS